ncbi:hypothetical protein L1987_36491 [Smallanthus sonchifolius]|uniref:Uncharacterized protein n=1 Tax=Smallanthus sonchifolius TaxID=185202 RepID=A0ACB9HDB5_9ASTR|nr:hypothetical protein L1987_36491 [Smallanthus sonchifolius]
MQALLQHGSVIRLPSSFDFFKKAQPSKKKRSKKNQRKQLNATFNTENEEGSGASAMQVEEETLNGLVSAVTKLTTYDSTPSAIGFGRRHTRGLTLVPLVLKSYKSRHQHLMDKHNFPSSFAFFKKAQPSKKERSKKNQRNATFNTENEEGSGASSMQVEEETLNGIVSAVSKLTTSDSWLLSLVLFSVKQRNEVLYNTLS